MIVRVKICGITRAEDADLACRLGASALGFVFWRESPRAIAVDAAQAIAHDVPALVTRVGVFVNAPVDEVREVVGRVPLDVVQLHGDEALGDYARVGARLVKAVALGDETDVARARGLPTDVLPLVDAADTERRGGTGRVANWRLARDLASQRATILAGGLTPDTVAAAIARVRPWAVDVASGVEERPGIKSPARLAAFFEAVAGVAGAERKEDRS